MKLSLSLPLAFIMASAGIANAGIITSVTQVGTSGGFDIYDVNLTGYNNAGTPDQSNNTTGILEVTGTFTASTGNLSVPGTDTKFPGATTNSGTNDGNSTAPFGSSTFVDLDSETSLTRTPDTATPTSLSGTWFTSSHTQAQGDLINLVNNPLLAEVWVATGDAFTFTGNAQTLFGTSSGDFAALNFSSTSGSPVPEPASLALLGLGTAGIMARRRRKA